MKKSEKENIMISNTYIPGKSTFMKMNRIKDDNRNKSSPEESKEVFENNEIVKPSLSNGWITNKLYKDLLTGLGLSSIENSMICEIYHDWIFEFRKKRVVQNKSKYNYQVLIKEIDPLLKQLIINQKSKGQSPSDFTISLMLTTLLAVQF